MIHFKVKAVPSGCCPKYEIYRRGIFKYRLIDTVKSRKAVANYMDGMTANYIVHYE